MPAPRAYSVMVAEHRRRLQRVIEKRGVRRLKSLYDRAQAEQEKKLARVLPRASTEFTPHVHRQVLGQLRQGQAVIAAHMAGELGDISREAQVESLRGLANSVRAMERHFAGTTPILAVDEASVFAGVIDKRRSSMLRMHEESMASYGGRLVSSMENELALSMLQAETVGEAVGRIQRVAGNEWWQAERIARTETSYAMNSAHADGVAEIAEEVPGLMNRWTEFCDDSGNPLDDRVGVDSLAMAGQLSYPGGKFTMPATSLQPDAKGNTSVPKSLVGESWEFPPNRPNDRATLVPWMPGWGAPGWIYKGGERHWLKR